MTEEEIGIKRKRPLSIREMQQEAHRYAVDQGFWEDRPRDRRDLYVPQCLALIHSEVSEALESEREENPEDEFGEELADIIIRVGDLAEETGVDLEEEILEKQEKNRQREFKHGKKF